MLVSASGGALSRLPVGSWCFLIDCDCDSSVLYALGTAVSFANFLTRALTTFALRSVLQSLTGRMAAPGSDLREWLRRGQT